MILMCKNNAKSDVTAKLHIYHKPNRALPTNFAIVCGCFLSLYAFSSSLSFFFFFSLPIILSLPPPPSFLGLSFSLISFFLSNHILVSRVFLLLLFVSHCLLISPFLFCLFTSSYYSSLSLSLSLCFFLSSSVSNF